MTYQWAYLCRSLVLPNALTDLQSLNRIHFFSGCFVCGLTMTFLGPLRGLYRPPADPVRAHVFLESCPSPVYPQVMQMLSFIPVVLLFSSFFKTFSRKLPKIYFLRNFCEGAPSSSIVTCRTPTFFGVTYIFFSLI